MQRFSVESFIGPAKLFPQIPPSTLITFACAHRLLLATILLASNCTFFAPADAQDSGEQKAASAVKEKAPSDLKSLSIGDLIDTQSLSFFGSRMDEAINTHFIERFSFRQYAFSVTDDGFTEILLRLPRLKPGRPFVSLVFALDQTGKIIRSKLSVKRRYIEDKIHGAFARDYAKSFVQAAVSFRSLEQVDSLVDEILYRQEIFKVKSKSSSSNSESQRVEELKEGDIIISGVAGKTPEVPSLPKHPSQMYQCFLGNIKVSKLKLSDAVLKFSNEKMNDEETLVITVEANGFEHSDEIKNVDFENLPMHVPAI